MRVGKIFKWGLLSLVALLVLLGVLLATLDLGLLGGAAQSRLSEAIGRQLTFEQGLSVRIGRPVVIEARGLRLANADWAGEGDLAYVERIYAEIDLASLWQGPPRIDRLELSGARLSLVQDADGRANWVLPMSAGKASDPAAENGLPVLVERVDVADVSIDLQTPRLDRPLELRLRRFEQRVDGSGRIGGSLVGEVNGQALEFTNTVETWDRLLSGADLRIEGQGQFGSSRAEFRGRFDNLWAPRRPELDLRLEAPSLPQLGQLLGVSGLGEGLVSVQASTRPAADHLEIEAQAVVGMLELNLRAEVPELLDRSRLALSANARGPNFGRLARLYGYPGWPEEAFGLDADIEHSDDGLLIRRMKLSLAGAGVFAEGALPKFPGLAGADLVLQVFGQELSVFRTVAGLETLPQGPFQLDGSIQRAASGQNRVDFDFSTPLGDGHIGGQLVDDTHFSIGLDMAGPDAARLGEMAGLTDMPLLAGQPWTLGLDLSMDGPQSYEVGRMEFNAAGFSLDLDGRVGADAVDQGTRVRWALTGERLSDLQPLAPESVRLPEKPFQLEGNLSAARPVWNLSAVQATIGQNTYRLSGALGMADDLAGTDLRVEAVGTDFGRLFDLPGEARLPEGPFASRLHLLLGGGQLKIESMQLEAGPLSMDFALELPWPIDLGRGRFRADAQGQDITRLLPEIADLDLDSSAFELHAAGAWNENQLSLENSHLRIGDSELTASGVVDLPPNVSATNLAINLRSPDLSRLGTYQGRRWGAVPLTLATEFSGNADTFKLERLNARLGSSEIRGIFELDMQPEVPSLDLRVTTDLLDLRPFLGQPGPDAQPPPKTGKARDERVIPDEEVPLDLLAHVNGRFLLGVDELRLRRATLFNNVMSGEIRDGGVTFHELGVDTFGGRLAATLALQPTPEGAVRFSAGIHSDGLVLDFIDVSPEDRQVLPRFDVDVDLEGTGRTIREIAATLNGKFIVFSPGGRVRSVSAASGTGHLLATIVTSISPMAAQRQEVGISCFATVGDISAGVVQLRPGMALQSDRLNILSRGTLDLGSERLDLRFNSSTRRAVDISAGELVSPYLKVTGTLASPAISIDPKGTLISGGAAFLSGGLSILAKKALDQLTDSDNPCTEFLEQAGESAPPR